MALDYIALGMLVFVVLVIFYGVIAIHDIPYEIAKRRNHPQQDAIHVAGWISLFTLHTLWPFLWIWATLWREDRGWGFTTLKEEQHDINHHVTQLSERIEQLKSDVESLKQQQQQQQNDQTMTQEKQEND
ncbi:DUF3302 domain-containing protein [Salinivibrio sp. EAGSL]|uniref:DUF3302 domain-containing protein n=1 Tax=Salinivibrio sp. EAGSL TaxID=2738468 RepID=UPI00158EFD1D|nr:DUF3302 domain-containing protein [Salinivibrio sp. EAGSL]NUY55940.1 DUF3302 domain-containing protein [Salinivibrio sp. EAGSL]